MGMSHCYTQESQTALLKSTHALKIHDPKAEMLQSDGTTKYRNRKLLKFRYPAILFRLF